MPNETEDAKGTSITAWITVVLGKGIAELIKDGFANLFWIACALMIGITALAVQRHWSSWVSSIGIGLVSLCLLYMWNRHIRAIRENQGPQKQGNGLLIFAVVVATLVIGGAMWMPYVYGPPRPQPLLSIDMRTMSVGELRESGGKVTQFIEVIASVSNRGGSSVADGFTLCFSTEGTEPTCGTPFVSAWGSHVDESNGLAMKPELKDDLQFKARSAPIPFGGQVTGSLLFLFPSVPQAVLISPTNDYKLVTKDILGTEVSHTRRFHAALPDGKIMEYPGMSLRHQRPMTDGGAVSISP